MYSIKRNLLLGLSIVLCYTFVSVYSAKLDDVSFATQAHQYGTDLAYNASEFGELRVSPTTIYNRAKINHLHSAGDDNRERSDKESKSEISRSGGYRSNEYGSLNRRADNEGVTRQPQINSVELERTRIASVLNAAVFLLGVTIVSLVFTGENISSEFDEKVIFLSTLILIDVLFIGGLYTMALPVLGLILLYGRRYLGTYFTPHQE